MVAVQTQYAASLPVAVAARCSRATPLWDVPALEDWLVKSWGVRHTLHAHTHEDYNLILSVMAERSRKRFMNWADRPGELLENESKMLARLAISPATRDELHEVVPEYKNMEMVGRGRDVMGLAYLGRLRIIGRGGTQRFAAYDAGPLNGNLKALLVRYLQAYGPATQGDFAHWVGLYKSQILPAFEQELWNENGMFDAPEASRDSHELPLIRLLAKFDPVTLSHKEKDWIIAPDLRKSVFRKAGQVEAIVLRRGAAVGTWRMKTDKTLLNLTVDLAQKLTKKELNAVETEAKHLAKHLGLKAIATNFSSSF